MRLSMIRPAALTSAIAVALLNSYPVAQAQDDTDSVVELGRVVVTVTAQKREQQVQDVPIAITALSDELLDELNISNFADINGVVPGLQTQVQSPNNPG